MTERRILLLMSGSIACAKATGLISAWVKQGHEVRVACTPSVAQFVGRATLEGLSGSPVFDDTFAAGRAMDHIELARWAQWLVVCPATANLINKLAAGIADDAVTTLWQAAWGREAISFIVPAMNTHMWRYPATQESVARLQRWGAHVLPTADGDLACGEQGEGRMLECVEILSHIQRLTDFQASHRRRRILVTGGGTREPLDAVRYIGNHSTGRTAARLVEYFDAIGHDVTWLGARDAIRPAGTARQLVFDSFADLDRQLRELLGDGAFDLVVHAAAVSDFSPLHEEGDDRRRKLSSDTTLTLRLAPNPKLLTRLRQFAGKQTRLRVIGFKLTAGAGPDDVRHAVARQFADSAVDAVVHNDLTEIHAEQHPFTLFRADGQQQRLADHAALAQAIAEFAEGDE